MTALAIYYAPTGVVDDLLHNSLDVAIALREVEGAELRGGLVVVGVGFELEEPAEVQRPASYVEMEGNVR